jgi:hypothetical protein
MKMPSALLRGMAAIFGWYISVLLLPARLMFKSTLATVNVFRGEQSMQRGVRIGWHAWVHSAMLVQSIRPIKLAIVISKHLYKHVQASVLFSHFCYFCIQGYSGGFLPPGKRKKRLPMGVYNQQRMLL